VAGLKEPWAAVRKVRLFDFDQDFRRVFNRTITSHKLHLLALLDSIINDVRPQLRPAVRIIADDVVESVNFHIHEEERDRDDFDPKVVFKSRAGVERLENDVLRQSRRQAQRDSEYLFQVAPDQRRTT